MDSAAFWQLIGQVLWGFVGVLTLVIWHTLNKRLDKIEEKADEAVSKIDYERTRMESLRDRADIRLDIKELFSKTDGVKDMMHQQIDQVKDQLSKEIRKVLDDMNGGFARLNDSIQQNRGDRRRGP